MNFGQLIDAEIMCLKLSKRQVFTKVPLIL